jgi:hypothetical protein
MLVVLITNVLEPEIALTVLGENRESVPYGKPDMLNVYVAPNKPPVYETVKLARLP